MLSVSPVTYSHYYTLLLQDCQADKIKLIERIKMQISFFTNRHDLSYKGGYHYASLGIITSLQKLGHTVPWNAADSPVKFNFCFPEVFEDELDPNQENIWLCAWESTKLQPEWYDIIDQVDQIWAASPWVKWMLESNGFKVNQVYRHGVDPVWAPAQRHVQNKVRFLYEGGAARKNPQLVYEAFKAAFGNNNDVELIIKEKSYSTVRTYDRKGNIIGYPEGNVRLITKVYEQDQMIQLFNMSHCFVSASSGEGYGLPAQQALATGMPTIATEECSPYTQFLGGLGLKSEYVDSPWPQMHPGQVLKPSFDDLVDKLRFVKDNVESLLDVFYKQSFNVHDWADWETLTAEAFEPIFEKYQ